MSHLPDEDLRYKTGPCELYGRSPMVGVVPDLKRQNEVMNDRLNGVPVKPDHDIAWFLLAMLIAGANFALIYLLYQWVFS